jgi:hypothetical protein
MKIVIWIRKNYQIMNEITRHDAVAVSQVKSEAGKNFFRSQIRSRKRNIEIKKLLQYLFKKKNEIKKIHYFKLRRRPFFGIFIKSSIISFSFNMNPLFL